MRANILNRLWAIMSAVLCACACWGCGIMDSLFAGGVGFAVYGSPAVPLEVKSFTFDPLDPIHPGETLTFTAEIAQVAEPHVVVYAVPGQTGDFSMELHDDGLAPDAEAGDFIFAGQAVWGEEYGTGKFTLRLGASGGGAYDHYYGQLDRILKVKP